MKKRTTDNYIEASYDIFIFCKRETIGSRLKVMFLGLIIVLSLASITRLSAQIKTVKELGIQGSIATSSDRYGNVNSIFGNEFQNIKRPTLKIVIEGDDG